MSKRRRASRVIRPNPVREHFTAAGQPKVGWDTEEEAREELRIARILSEVRGRPQPTRYYRCGWPGCNQFHLAHHCPRDHRLAA